jgi:hypothetical protein
MTEDDELYSVWIGGTEVNGYCLNLDEAQKFAKEYEQDGYQDVKIQKKEDKWDME